MPTNLNQVYKTSSLARNGNTVSVVRGDTTDLIGNRTWTVSGTISPNTSVSTTTGWSGYVSRCFAAADSTAHTIRVASPVTTRTNNVTVMFRIYINLSLNNAILWYVGDASFRGWGIFIASGKYAFLAGGVTGASSSFNTNTGVWTHVALRCNSANTWDMFVDGVKNTSSLGTFYPNPIGAGDNTSFLGYPGDTSSIYASMTDIVVVEAALTDAEITAYATAPFI